LLVILDGFKKNCFLNSGRFGVVGPKTAMEGWVRGTGCFEKMDNNFANNSPIFSG